MNAPDTNVLFYARDPRNPRKQAIAIDLIASLSDGVLMWQVACEYLAASQKLAVYGYSPAEAMADIGVFSRLWKTALPAWSALDRADNLRTRFGLSFGILF